MQGWRSTDTERGGILKHQPISSHQSPQCRRQDQKAKEALHADIMGHIHKARGLGLGLSRGLKATPSVRRKIIVLEIWCQEEAARCTKAVTQAIVDEVGKHGEKKDQLEGPVGNGKCWCMWASGLQTVPSHTVTTTLRPDLILHIFYFIEFTVPWEDHVKEANERKRLQYADMAFEAEQHGWEAIVCPVEVECRSFLTSSNIRLLKDLGIPRKIPVADHHRNNTHYRTLQPMPLDQEERPRLGPRMLGT